MRHTVVWLPRVEAKLTTIWTSAYTKGAIAEAADEIDRVLRTDPKRGQMVGDGYRLRVGALEVKYTVSAADLMVRVLDVRLLPTGNGSV